MTIYTDVNKLVIVTTKEVNRQMTTLLKIAHELKKVCEVSDPSEIREAVTMIAPCKISQGDDDVRVTLDGCEWRFIREDAIDSIMQDELRSDEYILGCFNDTFLAHVLDIDIDVIQAMQKAEAFEAIGKLVLSTGKLKELQEEYVFADGYGHHFGHYDGYEYNLSSQPYYAFKLG